jgi:hypothetical protein
MLSPMHSASCCRQLLASAQDQVSGFQRIPSVLSVTITHQCRQLIMTEFSEIVPVAGLSDEGTSEADSKTHEKLMPEASSDSDHPQDPLRFLSFAQLLQLLFSGDIKSLLGVFSLLLPFHHAIAQSTCS